MESSPPSQSEVSPAAPRLPPPHPQRLFQAREHAWLHLGFLHETGKLLEDLQTLESALPRLMALVTQVLPVRTALVLEGVDASGEPLPEPPRLHAWRTPEVSDPEFTRARDEATSRHAFLSGLSRALVPESAPEAPVPLPPVPLPLITLPLMARGRVSGTLQVQAAGALSEEGLAFIDAVVHQLARALERAHALRREVLRRERAEAGERRALQGQALVATASALLARTPEPRAALPELARLLVPAWADGCIIDLFPDDPAEGGGPERVAQCFVEPAEPASSSAPPRPLQTAFAVRALFTHPWATLAARVPGEPPLGGLERAAWPGFPANLRLWLRTRERVLGQLLLVSARPGRHDALDPVLLEALARHIAAAVDGARLDALAQRAARWHEDLLALVSHHLQTPLHLMTLTSEQLVSAAREGVPHPRQQQLFESLLHSAGRMREVLDEFEEHAAARGRGTPPRPRSHRVEELLDKALHLMRPLALGKGQQLVVNLGAGLGARLPPVRCDLERMLQVLTRLLGNAITVTPPGGRITLGARPQGDGVCLSVRDGGPALPAADLPRLFQPSARLASGRDHASGLLQARALVEAHGGRLWVESPPGGGNTFCFTLPGNPPG